MREFNITMLVLSVLVVIYGSYRFGVIVGAVRVTLNTVECHIINETWMAGSWECNDIKKVNNND